MPGLYVFKPLYSYSCADHIDTICCLLLILRSYTNRVCHLALVRPYFPGCYTDNCAQGTTHKPRAKMHAMQFSIWKSDGEKCQSHRPLFQNRSLLLISLCSQSAFEKVTLTPLAVNPHFTDSYQFSCVNSPESACLQSFQSTLLTKPLLFCTYARKALQSVHFNQLEIAK